MEEGKESRILELERSYPSGLLSWVEIPAIEVENKSKSLTRTYKGENNIHNPDVKQIIYAVSTILYSRICKDLERENHTPDHPEIFIFSEENYRNDGDNMNMNIEQPTRECIFAFIKNLYECAQFSPECCIVCLVYINRIISFTGLRMSETNWRPLLLSALLISQRIWDDLYLTNTDFAFIYPYFTTVQIDNLVDKFLSLIEFNVTIKASLYANYYFELIQLFNQTHEEFPLRPLEQSEADLLELRSDLFYNALLELTKANKNIAPRD